MVADKRRLRPELETSSRRMSPGRLHTPGDRVHLPAGVLRKPRARRPFPLMRSSATSVRLLAGALLATVVFQTRASARETVEGGATTAVPVSAEALKAAFLVNFVRFADWPAGTPGDFIPYSIGISGNRQLEDELIRLADRQLVRGHRIRVVRINSLADLAGLHVAYFDQEANESEGISAREALPLLRARPVLTVSNSPDFLAAGGMIRIFREEKALRFDISAETARDSGLVLSSRLLALARPRLPGPPQTVSSLQ